MKTIALIDTRSEIPGETLGILVSTHPNVMAAFAANDAFQQAEASGRHIRTKIVTLKGRLDVGQRSSRRIWPKANKPIHGTEARDSPHMHRGRGIQGCSETRHPLTGRQRAHWIGTRAFPPSLENVG